MRLSDWSSDVCSSDLDRLALGCATDILNAATGRLSEFVDVGARTWASRFRRDGGYDLRVMYGGDRRDRCDNRNRCLTTAGDHVDVRSIKMRVAIDDRDYIRDDRRRWQIDHGLACGGNDSAVAFVGTSRGGVEDNASLGQNNQPWQ